MMIPALLGTEVPALPDELWTTRYEEMRKRAMAKSCSIDHSYGYALLIRRGLVAWMKAWPRPAQEPPRDPGPAPMPTRSRSPRISSSQPPPCWST